MRKLTVTKIVGEAGGIVRIFGTCDFCNSFPCEHVDSNGDFTVDMQRLLPDQRIAWLKGEFNEHVLVLEDVLYLLGKGTIGTTTERIVEAYKKVEKLQKTLRGKI